MKNKKGMLGNIISAFIVILVGFTLMTTIQQELNNAINCNQTYVYEEATGKTDSFGGGGAAQFGGFDGEIKKPWGADYSPFKSNESIINPQCIPEVSESLRGFINVVPIVFVIAVLITAISMIYNALAGAGLIEGESEEA